MSKKSREKRIAKKEAKKAKKAEKALLDDGRIPEQSVFTFFLLSILTCGIYAIFFWNKLGKYVNDLCVGDGKKTMKYGPALFLSIITFGLFGIYWKIQLASRLKLNAERYELRIPEGGVEVGLFHTLGIIALGAGIPIADYIIIKNFNLIATAYNDYNGLEAPADEFIDIFNDSPVFELVDDDEEELVLID